MRGGVGGGVGNWYLLTPSALALWEFIVAVAAVGSCCSAFKMHDSVSLDALFNFQQWETKRELWNTHEQKTRPCEEDKEMLEVRDLVGGFTKTPH